MFDFEDVKDSDFPAWDWATYLPPIRDGRGARDHLAHDLLKILARVADWKTGLGAFLSVQTLADTMGMDESLIRRKLAFLVQEGAIRRMSVEEIAERGEGKKHAGGKTVPVDWESMAGGTQDLYTERWDPEVNPRAVAMWALAVDDEALWDRLEKAKYERQLTSKTKVLDKHKRHNAKRYGTPPPEAPRKERVPKAAPPVVQVQEAPDEPAQPQQKPNFGRGIPKQLPAADPEPMTPNLAEQLIEYVMPKLDPAPADIKHAKTILMKFADRWPRCLEMAQYATRAVESRPGSAMEIGCFEEGWDPNFAVPLNAKVEEAA
jgi:hypothetical protein